MRIVDSIPHPTLKISLFSLDTRWTVKFEDGPAEITLKYRKEDFPSVEEVKKLFDDRAILEVNRELNILKKKVGEQLSGKGASPEDEFPDIL